MSAAAPVRLEVMRNLSCSEGLADNKNQSVHTRWNCLVSRKIDGKEAIPSHLTINGALAPPIPPHISALLATTAKLDDPAARSLPPAIARLGPPPQRCRVARV